MNKKLLSLKHYVGILIILLCSFCSQFKNKNNFSSKVKIALREAGNELLLSQGDSISLILPIREVSKNKFEISFENKLDFEPNQLVTVLKQNINKIDSYHNYRVEVIQCLDKEVAYSYEIHEDQEKTIIPCINRILPKQCYLIQVLFLENKKSENYVLYYIFIPLILSLLYRKFVWERKKKQLGIKDIQRQKVLGSFLFYPEQNKLVRQSKEIALSNKECELLEIFTSNLNDVVTREELTKKVWEDNGVIVGRSLDTYISKLRKKLQEDSSLKLTNIHGVGYKLEHLK